LASARERRFRVYKEAPGIGPGPRERERDASACIRRHQAFALPPVRERRFRVYKAVPGFARAPVRETLPRV